MVYVGVIFGCVVGQASMGAEAGAATVIRGVPSRTQIVRICVAAYWRDLQRSMSWRDNQAMSCGMCRLQRSESNEQGEKRRAEQSKS